MIKLIEAQQYVIDLLSQWDGVIEQGRLDCVFSNGMVVRVHGTTVKALIRKKALVIEDKTFVGLCWTVSGELLR